MMFWVKVVEYMEGWVWDIVNGGIFFLGMMIGFFNFYLKFVFFGFCKVFREEDCIFCYENLNEIYLKIFNMVGFIDCQKIDVGFVYGFWLEYKGIVGLVSIIYEDVFYFVFK